MQFIYIMYSELYFNTYKYNINSNIIVVEVKNVKPSTNTIADVFATFPIVISDNNNNDIVPFEIEKNYVAEVVVENDEVTLNNPTSDNSDTSNYDSSSND